MISVQEVKYWNAPRPLPPNEAFVTIAAGETFGQNYRMNRVNSWECVCAYIVSGCGTLVYDDKTINLSQGDVFLLHKNSDHTYYSDNDDPFRFLWFNCTGKLWPMLFQAYELDQRVIIPQYNDPSLFVEFHEICRTHTDPHEIYQLCGLQFHRIVASFAEHLIGMKKNDTLAYRVKRYLDERLNESLSLQKLSQSTGYSTAYIGRCFKAAYGQTPYQYLLQEKLTAAEKLLSQTDMKIRQVAALFVFNDEFHFSNAFYKHFGYRPNDLRKRKK